MMNGERHNPADEPLDGVIERAVHVLRSPEPVSPAWRAQLLAHVETRRRSHGAAWRWIPVGLAAALCTAAVGLRLVRHSSAATDATSGVAAVRFAVSAPAARRVSLVGDFDQWNPTAVPMRRDVDGHTWVVDVSLPPGRHVFAYSVDGGLRADPSAPRAVEDDFGVPSSVVVVPSRGGD